MTFRALLTIIGIIILGSARAFAQSADYYCDDKQLGEEFYCEKEAVVDEPEITPEEKPVLIGPPAPPKPDELEELDAFKQELDTARKRAVFTGEREDIRQYMILQKKAGEMSSRFMTEYQVLGWQNPDLSYTAGTPINTGAKRAYRAERRKEVELHVRNVNQRYGIYYFYSRSCAACTTFSPIVKMLSSRHQLTVIPVARRGQESVEWPGTKPENGIGERLGLSGNVTPALVLFDTKERVGVPISYGVVTLEDLENRIYMLTREEGVKFLGGSNDTY